LFVLRLSLSLQRRSSPTSRVRSSRQLSHTSLMPFASTAKSWLSLPDMENISSSSSTILQSPLARPATPTTVTRLAKLLFRIARMLSRTGFPRTQPFLPSCLLGPAHSPNAARTVPKAKASIFHTKTHPSTIQTGFLRPSTTVNTTTRMMRKSPPSTARPVVVRRRELLLSSLQYTIITCLPGRIPPKGADHHR